MPDLARISGDLMVLKGVMEKFKVYVSSERVSVCRFFWLMILLYAGKF